MIQHGTLTNRATGQTLTGNSEGPAITGTLGFLIDGTEFKNVFSILDWDFEPDGPELPTEPGLYQPKRAAHHDSNHTFRVFKLRHGNWSELEEVSDDFPGERKNSDEVVKMFKDYADAWLPLVKLVVEK